MKVADGKVLGAIPRCPSCFGGRPRFDYISGMYRCPGYRDDEDFVNCNRTYNLGDLTRTSWEEWVYKYNKYNINKYISILSVNKEFMKSILLIFWT